jgi:type III secretion protein C
MRIKCLIQSLSLILWLILVSHTYADNQAWRKDVYRHVSINQDVIQLLESFAAEQGFSIIFSEAIKTRKIQKVNGSFNQSAESFLNEICNLNNLIWFYDGQTLFFYGSEEQVSKILSADSKQALVTKNALMKLGIMDDRFGWIYLPEERILHIHGPPAYISIIENLYAKLAEVKKTTEKEMEVESEQYVIQVFPLSYAWAEDQYYDVGGTQKKIEGVASKLRKMFNIVPANSEREVKKLEQASGVNPQNLPNEQRTIAPTNSGVKGVVSNEYSGLVDAMNNIYESKSYIQADELTNSVIIYDKASSIGLYEKTIKSMDISVAQVQIEVSIIEINTDRLNQLGIDWRLSGNDGSASANNISAFAASGEGANISFNKPGDFSTIFTGDASKLITRVHALSNEGEGQVMSQPAVLTMNNASAMIDNSKTFFVQLEGVEQVDLREIKVGSLLKVTPRIINEAGTRRVQLKTTIEDGLITSQEVDRLPVIQKSVIDTNTIIGENTSLLIGGYFFDRIKIKESKVPFLGSIPVLELMFKTKMSERAKVARMFLITPTIIDNIADEQYKFASAKQFSDEIKTFKKVKPVSPSYKIFD